MNLLFFEDIEEIRRVLWSFNEICIIPTTITHTKINRHTDIFLSPSILWLYCFCRFDPSRSPNPYHRPAIYGPANMPSINPTPNRVQIKISIVYFFVDLFSDWKTQYFVCFFSNRIPTIKNKQTHAKKNRGGDMERRKNCPQFFVLFLHQQKIRLNF